MSCPKAKYGKHPKPSRTFLRPKSAGQANGNNSTASKPAASDMFKNLKIGPKFVLSLLLISIVPLAVISIFYDYYSKAELENKTIGRRQAVNNSRAAHIN